jgi:hypothetical protein
VTGAADDEPRFLGVKLGYAAYPTVDSVECISESEQSRQTLDAHRRRRTELLRTWIEARSSILDGVERFKTIGRLDRKLRLDLRLVERGVRALDRDVLGP